MIKSYFIIVNSDKNINRWLEEVEMIFFSSIWIGFDF